MPTPSRRPEGVLAVSSGEFDFYDALRDVVRGCRITRKDWPDGMRVFLQGGVLHISIPAGAPDLVPGVHKFIVSEADICATDWVVAR